jgi:hypothetical protein
MPLALVALLPTNVLFLQAHTRDMIKSMLISVSNGVVQTLRVCLKPGLLNPMQVSQQKAKVASLRQTNRSPCIHHARTTNVWLLGLGQLQVPVSPYGWEKCA